MRFSTPCRSEEKKAETENKTVTCRGKVLRDRLTVEVRAKILRNRATQCHSPLQHKLSNIPWA